MRTAKPSRIERKDNGRKGIPLGSLCLQETVWVFRKRAGKFSANVQSNSFSPDFDKTLLTARNVFITTVYSPIVRTNPFHESQIQGILIGQHWAIHGSDPFCRLNGIFQCCIVQLF